jgi:DnaK suppressor protein
VAGPEELTAVQRTELESDLRLLKRELAAQLQRLEQDSKPVELDQQMVGRLSRMDAMQQQQMAVASEAHVRAHLSRVSQALAAISAGDFGFCAQCDEAIAWLRMKARPDSRLCVQCQQLNEM